jgi:hypothetical protein
MTTRAELITQFKADYPTLTEQVNDIVTELNTTKYEATIERWADNQIESEAKALKAATDKAAATAKLAALGLTTDDLKALGLGTN